ncbi:hypothetical protein JOF48_001963 [Arthrobacter stackebrandtii]|uniref:Uncharacterized protein n=1 Tax=Arthrobacter stackebrandtii TaxID=272161 RepID=A0ABS4YWP7_9MICC|nr:hypothetical protein [Arthrobacter stackebrandtii]MBP2413164.1 hypothetical protein [Arthrobacter stackebrandtii]
MARAVRIALGVSLFLALFVLLGSTGASASTTSDPQPAPRHGLLSGILNPVVGVVDQTLSQVPVVKDITGPGTVGKITAPVTGLTDHVENTLTQVPVVENVVSPVREVATTVVPPVTDVVSAVTTPVLGAVGQATAPVVEVAAPVLDPVTTAVAPIVGGVTDTVAGVTGGTSGVVVEVVDNVVAPAIPAIPGVTVPPVSPESPTPATPVTPAAPVAPVVPQEPGTPGAPSVPGTPASPDAPAAVPSAPVISGEAGAVVPGSVPQGADGLTGQQNSSPQQDQAVDSEKLPKGNRTEAAGQDASAEAVSVHAPAAPSSRDVLARYFAPSAMPGTSTATATPAQTVLAVPGGSAPSAVCGADDSRTSVGPCAPAVATGPASAPSSGVSSAGAGGSGATGGAAAAHENTSELFLLAGGPAALPNVDWPLPASQPSDPGSTPD